MTARTANVDPFAVLGVRDVDSDPLDAFGPESPSATDRPVEPAARAAAPRPTADAFSDALDAAFGAE